MDNLSRRNFLKFTAGNSAILAGGFGQKNVEKLIPYVTPPENIRPGNWSIYATTCRECPAGCGMHLRNRDGHVVNAYGNPSHPINKGGLCPRGQSSVQGLYDPDRMKKVLCAKCGQEMDTWDGPFSEMGDILKRSSGKITIISDIQSGSLYEIMKNFVEAFGSGDRIYLYEPFNYEPMRRAYQLLFGQYVIPQYHLDKADFIISFSADFLESWVSNVQFARMFSQMHSYNGQSSGRMTYIGPRFSMTAANADDFLQVSADVEYAVALAMLNVIIEKGWARQDMEKFKLLVQPFTPEKLQPFGVTSDKVVRLAETFAKARDPVVLAGPVGASGKAATDLAVAAALLNYSAASNDQIVDFSRTHALSNTITNEKLKEVLAGLTDQDVLIVHNANPAYYIPKAAEYIRKAGTKIYIGTMADETAKLSPWNLPADSPLESWGDYEPWTGLHCLMQPAMAKLYGTLSSGDIFLTLSRTAGKPLSRGDVKEVKTFEQWLKLRWQDIHAKVQPSSPFSDFWEQALRNGFVNEAQQNKVVTLRDDALNITFGQLAANDVSQPQNCRLWVWSSILHFDGRVANRGWLQETAEPISSIAWGNIADLHPRKALALGLKNGDEIEIKTTAGKIKLPVRITEDITENAVAVSFGQGHTALGRLAKSRGANVFDIISTTEASSIFGNATIQKTGKNIKPVYLTSDQEQYKREIIQWVGLSELKNTNIDTGQKLIMPLPEGYDPKKDLYPPHEYKNHRWAMVIDLDRCIGCAACTVACYAENNIAVMGADSSRRWLEMAWLRIIPYRDNDNPRQLGFLPLLCQHCDAAPCEPVCPVFASVHNDEGLNAQVYNRCIGTRYCSNNCPYKVRRFNWLNVDWKEPLNMQLNPEVSVRVRGVMEKCTFCIQRIREAELKAKREHRKVMDGEIQPACLQSCPTKAFTFGDLLDSNSQVSKLTRTDPRRYHILEELNTKPAVTYLRRIKNDEVAEDTNA
jgi:Fe-S-cluster-containing dehydrogenase component/anaerobic selenocysteine-containing dehydrogenase